jgi:RNA polymerase sigma-70 factor (ECF subfamily)
VSLVRAKFHNINFSDITVTAAQMGGAKFKHIGPPPDKEGKQERQRPVMFEEMMLCDSTFRKVDLSNAKIIDCDLRGMTIDGVLVTDLIAAYRSHTKKDCEEGSGANAATPRRSL